MMNITTFINKDNLKLADKVVRFDSKYAKSGLNGYLRDVFINLADGSGNNLFNPGVKYENKYMDLQNSYDHVDFDFNVEKSVTLKLDVKPEMEKRLKNLDYQLRQGSFWNLSRITDYVVIQILTGLELKFDLPFDQNTTDILDDAKADWEVEQMTSTLKH